MDMKQVVLGLSAVLLGGAGIKVLRDRQYRKYLVDKFGADFDDPDYYKKGGKFEEEWIIGRRIPRKKQESAKTRTFVVSSVDYDTGQIDDLDLPQDFTFTLDEHDTAELEGSTDMQEIADLLVDNISDETGWLVDGFYFQEKMPDGTLVSLDAESFSADTRSCKTYTCRTEYPGVGKGSDAMRFVSFLKKIKKEGVRNIKVDATEYDVDWNTVKITFDFCSHFDLDVEQVKNRLWNLISHEQNKRGKYGDLHRCIQTIAEGYEPDPNYGAESFSAENVEKNLILDIKKHWPDGKTITWKETGDMANNWSNFFQSIIEGVENMNPQGEWDLAEVWFISSTPYRETVNRRTRSGKELGSEIRYGAEIVWFDSKGRSQKQFYEDFMKANRGKKYGDMFNDSNLLKYGFGLRWSFEKGWAVETFEAPYGGAGSLMDIGKETPLADFTDEELTTSSAIHGDFDQASLNYSGHQNLEVRAEDVDFYELDGDDYVSKMKEMYQDFLDNWDEEWPDGDNPPSFEEWADMFMEQNASLFYAETHAYTYAYNEGHSDSRKSKEYRPNLVADRDKADFKRILKQKGD